MMAIMNSYLNNRDVSHRVEQKWAKDRGALLGSNFFNSTFFSNYERFKLMFEEWINELERNEISFAPFYKDSDVRDSDGLAKVQNTKPTYPGLNPFRKKGFDLVDEMLGKNLSSIPSNTSAPITFMEVFHKTLSDICKKNLNIQ